MRPLELASRNIDWRSVSVRPFETLPESMIALWSEPNASAA
jgi:hypothetical protein